MEISRYTAYLPLLNNFKVKYKELRATSRVVNDDILFFCSAFEARNSLKENFLFEYYIIFGPLPWVDSRANKNSFVEGLEECEKKNSIKLLVFDFYGVSWRNRINPSNILIFVFKWRKVCVSERGGIEIALGICRRRMH
ncbi:hypothetical protein CEXT_422731 [Caerostris extrusa]|uniref:Uncharacterized protein n=1 Tax=Caerostris extrusa TaxID=172846 RepID=A0AAV4Y281_CAEEX|nr:hypothetical protein CEXT_422731 [Caerostris extrusa]